VDALAEGGRWRGRFLGGGPRWAEVGMAAAVGSDILPVLVGAEQAGRVEGLQCVNEMILKKFWSSRLDALEVDVIAEAVFT
jgi:hypothetical protein